MVNVNNESKVVKKELSQNIIKFCVADPNIFINCDKLTDPTYHVFEKLIFLSGLGRSGLSIGIAVKKIHLMSFKDIADFQCQSLSKNNIDTVHIAISELLSKGYLFRDEDGTLAFTPTGSVQ